MLKLSIILGFLIPLIKPALILLIGFIVIKCVMKIVTGCFDKSKTDPSLAKYCVKFIRIALSVFLILIALDSVGVSTSGIVTAMSAAVVAIGLALKDSLGNIAGGILLLFSPRFSTGDFISAGGCDGTVVSIELMHTTLRTPDSKQISIPNGMLVSDRITNYSVEKNRRLDIVIPIPYEADVNKAKQLAFDTVSKHPLVNKEIDVPFVRVKDYGDSAVNLIIRVWCDNKDYWNVNFDLIEQVREVLEQNGISIPYNQLDVRIKNN